MSNNSSIYDLHFLLKSNSLYEDLYFKLKNNKLIGCFPNEGIDLEQFGNKELADNLAIAVTKYKGNMQCEA